MKDQLIELYLCCANRECGEHQTVLSSDIPLNKPVLCPSCGQTTVFDRYTRTFHETRPFVFMVGRLSPVTIVDVYLFLVNEN